jgi:hypothetical protein
MLTYTTHALESEDVQLGELTAKHQAAVTELQTTKVCMRYSSYVALVLPHNIASDAMCYK